MTGEISVPPGWRLVVEPSSEHFADGSTAARLRMERIPEDSDPEDSNMVSVSLHPALVEAFIDWLDGRGLSLSPPIPDGTGDTFRVVVPRTLGGPS